MCFEAGVLPRAEEPDYTTAADLPLLQVNPGPHAVPALLSGLLPQACPTWLLLPVLLALPPCVSSSLALSADLHLHLA